MSKTLDDLKKISVDRDMKYTAILKKQEDKVLHEAQEILRRSAQPSVVAKSRALENDAVIFHKWLLVLVAFGILVLSGILSFMAFTQVKSTKVSSIRLGQIAFAQDGKIKSLDALIEKTNAEAKEKMAALNEQMGRQAKEISAVLADNETLRQDVKDLKDANRRMLDKVINLSSEVKLLKDATNK